MVSSQNSLAIAKKKMMIKLLMQKKIKTDWSKCLSAKADEII
jgi:hypothetical protein